MYFTFWEFPIENLMKKMKHVAMDEHEFEYRDKSLLKVLIVFFGLLEFWCKDQT